MGVSARSADIRLNEALTLDDRLPRTMAALSAGILGMPAVRVLVTETLLLDAAGAAEVESRVLDHLGGQAVPDLGRLTPNQITALPVEQVESMAGFATSTVVRRVTRRAVTQVDADAQGVAEAPGYGPILPETLHQLTETHDPGWHLVNHNNGTFTWTTPWRTTYTVMP